MNNKRMLIIFAGLHYNVTQCYNQKTDTIDTSNPVDFRQYVKNIKNTLVNDFEKKGYAIDFGIATNNSPYLNELVDAYKPCISVIQDNATRLHKINEIIVQVCNEIEQERVKYDLICITRVDIYFMNNFDNVDVNKFNVVSVLETDNLVDDNLYIFPVKYIRQFASLIGEIENNNVNNNRLILHHAKERFHKLFDVNYIKNEHVRVPNLTFFKLHIFDNIQFSMDNLMFSDNVTYTNKTSTATLTINDSIVELCKIVQKSSPYTWIGYNLEHVSQYNVSFTIKSDKLINFDYIKLHKPTRFIHSQIIQPDIETNVNVSFKTSNRDDFLCFIFDNYNDTIKIEFKNIEIKQTNQIIEQSLSVQQPMTRQIIRVDNGIILNQLDADKIYVCNDMSIVKNDDIYTVTKKQTMSTLPFRWFGHWVEPVHTNLVVSFDIKFNDSIPRQDEKFAIKTHEPDEYYTDWLGLCKVNEFVHITIPIYVYRKRQLIILIMDQYLKSCSFQIKNMTIMPMKVIKKPRVAILMAGEMRNYDTNDLLNLNNANFYDRFDYDIFVSTWSKRGSSPYHQSITKKPYADFIVTETDIRNSYKNIKGIHIENFDKWLQQTHPKYKEIYDKGIEILGTKHVIKCTVFPQFYKIWDANEMKKKYEKMNNFKYDIVFRIRPDMGFVEPIPSAYLGDFEKDTSNLKIWTMNPPKNFYPKRIYDIFFYGNSTSMDLMCSQWNNIVQIIQHPYDNGLLSRDSCRVLYVACLVSDIKVIDLSRCIGEVYRDEKMCDFVNKILTIFN